MPRRKAATKRVSVSGCELLMLPGGFYKGRLHLKLDDARVRTARSGLGAELFILTVCGVPVATSRTRSAASGLRCASGTARSPVRGCRHGRCNEAENLQRSHDDHS